LIEVRESASTRQLSKKNNFGKKREQKRKLKTFDLFEMGQSY